LGADRSILTVEPKVCSRCGRASEVELRYNGLSLCRKCFVSFFEKRVRRTIGEYELIQTGDRIAVALSGGKDSVTALHLLDKFNRMHGDSIDLIAISIDQGIKGIDDKNLRNADEVARERGIEHHVFSFREELGHTVDELASLRPGVCNCGVFRRQILNRKARELGANKLATGHNLDDEVESALMNFMTGNIVRMTRGDGIVNSDKFVRRIKPLRRSPEEEVALYASIVLPEMEFAPECPYRGEVIRRNVKRVMDELERRHPGIRYQILESSEKLRNALVQGKTVDAGIRECQICGEPSSGDTCNMCKLLAEIGQLAATKQTGQVAS
jgi:uncharacterized protein (TIGR00269 family)